MENEKKIEETIKVFTFLMKRVFPAFKLLPHGVRLLPVLAGWKLPAVRTPNALWTIACVRRMRFLISEKITKAIGECPIPLESAHSDVLPG